MRKRYAAIGRKTRETDIRLRLLIEGRGEGRADTGIGWPATGAWQWQRYARRARSLWRRCRKRTERRLRGRHAT